jgi:hypothetical protein
LLPAYRDTAAGIVDGLCKVLLQNGLGRNRSSSPADLLGEGKSEKRVSPETSATLLALILHFVKFTSPSYQCVRPYGPIPVSRNAPL